MTTILIFTAMVIFLCIAANKFADRIGMPVLICFICLGMFFGVDGPFGIAYDDYSMTEKICSVALAFVMFYGGFGTKWKTAKPVAAKAILLSGVGVVLTALSLTAFCMTVFGLSFAESFLVGAVVSSTDAASVFSILRSKKLALKYGTDSLLEIESGSNDPVSYLLTAVAVSLLTGQNRSIGYMLFSQIVYGAAIGILTALVAIFILTRTELVTRSMDAIFIVAVVLASYALPDMIGGNGYLSVYLTGILLGNSRIENKKVLVPFFDGITNLAQISIFFFLGLLSVPHMMSSVIGMALAIAAFLLFVGRPLMVFILMKPFKAGWHEILCISWAGLRGASSIVFAIYAVSHVTGLKIDLFHIVYTVSLLSVAIQGTLLPKVAGKLKMIDDETDVLKTFNDYQEDSSLTLMRMYIPSGHNWENKLISQVNMPTGSLALMIKRGSETLIPKGDTRILADDNIILSVPSYNGKSGISLREIPIDAFHEWCGRSIGELDLPDSTLIAMVRRGDENIIPQGQTVLKNEDIVVIYDN